MHMNYLSGMLADVATPAVTTTTAASGTPATPPPSSPFGMLVPMVLIFVVMYFLMIRPQSQRAKQQKKLLESLKSGDKVVTAAGIVGTVITVKDNTVSLRSADAKFEVTKSSVTEI